jgi:hypothetical protein
MLGYFVPSCRLLGLSLPERTLDCNCSIVSLPLLLTPPFLPSSLCFFVLFALLMLHQYSLAPLSLGLRPHMSRYSVAASFLFKLP